MWPLGAKPSAVCMRIDGTFVSSVEEKRRGVGETASTDLKNSRAMPLRRKSSRTTTRLTNVHWNQSRR